MRRHNNPLFGDRRTVSEDDLLVAQESDRKEREGFYEQFQTVLQEIAEFSGQEDSEKILSMKQGIDRMYEQCRGLAGENQKAIDGLARLQNMIMQAITQGAADDATALKELEQEAAARTLHQQLLNHPIVCDLLRPDSVIKPDELAASILSANDDAVRAAMNLFQAEHLDALIGSCEELIESLTNETTESIHAEHILELLRESRVAD